MQKIAPILAILLIIGLLGSNIAHADYTDWLKIRIESDKPNVCIFEAESAKVDFNKRSIYKKTVEWIKKWSKELKKEDKIGNWDFTYELILNSTHFDKKEDDFTQCNIMILFDAENLSPPESDLNMAQGYTYFDYSHSTHKYAVIDVFTWSPTNTIVLQELDPNNMKKNPDGSVQIPLTFKYKPVSDDAIRIVLQHEFGHAMGLGHWTDTTTNDFTSIMMPSFNPTSKKDVLKAIKITPDDIKALIELYGKNGFSKNYHDPVPEFAYGLAESVRVLYHYTIQSLD